MKPLFFMQRSGSRGCFQTALAAGVGLALTLFATRPTLNAQIPAAEPSAPASPSATPPPPGAPEPPVTSPLSSPGFSPPPAGSLLPQTAQSAAEPEFRDIVPPVEVPFWTGGRILVALLLAGASTVLLAYLFRFWQRRPRPMPEPPDPRQIALRALFQLRSAADGEMESRDFAAAVAEILRDFLEARYEVAAPKQTTEEFLETAQTSGKFPGPAIARLSSFLNQCDLLKFARGEASAAAKHELLNIAESQVREATT